MSPVLLLIVVIVGTHAMPVTLSEDSINKIDQVTIREEKIANEDSGDPPVFEHIVENSDTNSTSKPSLLAWFLTPLAQINPQTLQNRVSQLKEALKNLGLGNRNDSKGKQLNNANNLLHVASVSDSGFYTDRLQPAGFFGGNGWLANKGGILGRPGAILSTGSILTDYPSAYRRK
ncbi:uncharacterized protein LOC117162656 [Bombus vancouverensis nearcticus]|uniref:uncharacterized protein LOC117162656 n=1 Tax=Bombus vancouverensis nearcticus TaxID=2705178 RepID=UPI00402B6637